ncbi:COG4223 family protein [Rubellimicrobium roseum]|uniref:Mitochondrial inner membrane protein n=1 Tax=Rubellimicrobium roseum TaxID=687525 RepID=A0A5C4NJN2_9RHOB|nr:mitofilin family membrane protein [Rubellimicrobium roseum]TNC74332.1 hypothetical protein FHG71_03895 [Rubellimicrobium roseum]
MARKPGPKDRAQVTPEAEADRLPAERAEILPEATETFLPPGREAEMPPEESAAPDAATVDEGPGEMRPAEPVVPSDPVLNLGPEASPMVEPVAETPRVDLEDWRSAPTPSAEAVPSEPSPTVVEPAPSLRTEEPASPPFGASARPFASDEPAEPRRFQSDLGTPVSSSAPPPEPRRRSGVGGLLLGGMIAAALGFGAAWLAQDRLGLFAAQLPADLEERIAALEAQPVAGEGDVQALADRLAEAESRLSALEATPAPSGAADLEPLRAELAQDIEARASDLERRIAAIESRPATPVGSEAPLGSLAVEDVAAATPTVEPDELREQVLSAVEPRLTGTEETVAELQAALADLDTRLDAAEQASSSATEQARAAAQASEQIEARAAAAEAQARRSAIVAQLDTALDSGEPFEPALSELEAVGAQAPEALSSRAAEGVPTLADLRESFPEAARAALAAARDGGLVDDGDGVMGFLAGQLSLRSTAPRDGTDPDAVLSRAEDHLGQGRLGEALAEIETLPEAVRTTMNDWIAAARTRVEADAALDTLRDTPATSTETTAAD